MKIIKKIKNFIFGYPIVFFHEFHKPPYGGGNQFLLALKKELESRGYKVGVNRCGSKTKVCLFNSFNFNFKALEKIARKKKVKMIHRVDGPISPYRGEDDGTDKRICEINNKLADATIFQSLYSLKKHEELGLYFKNSTIIHNAVDGAIFNQEGRASFPKGERKIRIIAASWSDNPRKGGPVYKWLDDQLDWNKYEFTFVGRTKETFKNIKHLEALPSEDLAKILKQHDIYITASENDPCSNSVVEALACGLPVVYLNSGGHPELVGQGGLAFDKKEDIVGKVEEISKNYGAYKNNIRTLSIAEVADKYLEVLGYKL